MERDELMAQLRYPLYQLHYLDSLEGFEFSPDEAKHVVEHYGPAHVNMMVLALDWARQTPDLVWAEVLPNLSHDDAAIRHYIQTSATALRAAVEAT